MKVYGLAYLSLYIIGSKGEGKRLWTELTLSLDIFFNAYI